MPCKYVIHTVGPVWSGGGNGEKELLSSCYSKSLELAINYGVESIAFPLISSGAYGYPKDKALEVAVDSITKFLEDNEITAYIVIYDKNTLKIDRRIESEVNRFISENYNELDGERVLREERLREKSFVSVSDVDGFDDYDGEGFPLESCSASSVDGDFDGFAGGFNVVKTAKRGGFLSSLSSGEESEIVKLLNNIDDSFTITLLKLIDLKGLNDVECYKKANVSKQTWYKIMNEKSYKPSKNTVLSFAIALKLTLEETNGLLNTVGFTLSNSSKFDIIIKYFISIGEYDIFKINEVLFKFDEVCLGV